MRRVLALESTAACWHELQCLGAPVRSSALESTPPSKHALENQTLKIESGIESQSGIRMLAEETATHRQEAVTPEPVTS